MQKDLQEKTLKAHLHVYRLSVKSYLLLSRTLNGIKNITVRKL